jgi:Meiotically up-regulated gene 113/Domain of unknown function (DUF4041)
MSIFLGILAALFLGLFVITLLKSKRLEKEVVQRDVDILAAKQETADTRLHYEAEAHRIHGEAQVAIAAAQKIVDQQVADAQTSVAEAQKRVELQLAENEASLGHAYKLVDQQLAEMRENAERVRQHYETEARKYLETLEPLRKYEGLRESEAEVQRLVAEAVKEAAALRAEAQTLLEQSRNAATEERSQANRKAKEIREQADALLDRATRDAGRIVEEAHKRAEQIGGDAYIALRDKETLERGVASLWNTVDGYGDRYVIPTRSLLDDLASDFGHTEAGEALRAAREQTRRMVEEKQASACNYVEEDRRNRANRFVVDAFNGRVDAIQTRIKHDNYGTLAQEMRDAFALVNLNGIAFRDARILPAYLDARLAELKWAVVVQELKRKEREEQRRIKEQMREEEKARREYERAMKEAEEEEEVIKKALEKARLEIELANVEQKAKFEEEIAMLNQKLVEAEAKNQRALSMAQQTRKGTVYIISNVGSFGEGVFKIGMTRRLEPDDRIKELGDASVPFEFDVHAMIPSDDAPALEYLLHTEFDDVRINQVNFRKEFFRVSIERLKSVLATKNIEASFTMLADAHEYRESQALSKMTPEEREKYHLKRSSGDESGFD